MPAQKQQPTWAEIVKGKQAIMEAAEQKFQFNPEVQEFKFNPEVQEFKPQTKQSLNPSAKDFDPQLNEKAAHMTNLLLECFSDSDDDDDEVAEAVNSKAMAPAQQLNPFANEFSPPVTQRLNPSAQDFDPQLMQKAAQMAKLLECYSDSDADSDDDDDDANAKASACKQLNPSAKVFSPPAVPVHEAQRGVGDVKSPTVVAFRPPPGLTLPDVTAVNMDCYSSDEESEGPPITLSAARKRTAKLASGSSSDSDSGASTSAGKTSDSDTESLYM